MIIVHGKVNVRPDLLAAALKLSIEHVLRSRAEPGCLEHGVTQDPEVPTTLQFVERWADKPALLVHFAVRESIDFVRGLSRMAAAKPEISIFGAEVISLSTDIQA